MVHTRLNERTVNPNTHINFIRALPPPGTVYGSGEDSEAKEMLRALAAQLRPVMKHHGFTVNSLEEYEGNRVFLGRNWNNGETIELVLRGGDGRFYPASRILGVFCHELAHIKHMNHSGAFHALRRQLSSEVSALQRQGYYGDGYWSAGTRLSDSERVLGEGISAQEFPEYTCGGAHPQSRSSALPARHRRPRRRAGPSLSSGAQNEKQRKAGSRVKYKAAFESAGEGSILDERVEKGGKGSGFRRQAGSQRAREERARAAERRLKEMQGNIQELQEKSDSETEGEEDREDLGCVAETDEDRLKRMRDVMGDHDLIAMQDDADNDVEVVFGTDTASNNIPLSDEESPAPRIGGSFKRRFEGVGYEDGIFKKQKLDGSQRIAESSANPWSLSGSLQGPSKYLQASSGSFHPAPSSHSPSVKGGGILREEVQHRKREALGLDRPRTLGPGAPASETNEEEWACDMCTFMNPPTDESCVVCQRPRRNGLPEKEWSCSVCTFDNRVQDSKCAMCDHPKT